MSRSKNLVLSLVLVSLVGLTFWLFVREKSEETNFETKINVGISNDALPDSILLIKKSKTDFLSWENGSFYFNNDFRVKPELEDALIVILQQLEVRRPVSEKMHKMLSIALDTAGISVKVYEKAKLLSAFDIWGDKENSKTYLRLPGTEDIYLADIPGYSTYIADIFFYSESAWKNNALFESTWRSLRRLDLRYPYGDFKNTSIEYSGEYFEIDQLKTLDTLAVLDYLEQFSKIRVNRYLPDSAQLLDSIRNEQAALIVAIDDLESLKSNSYSFYLDSTEAEPRVLVVGKDDMVGVITLEKFKVIAKDLSFFSEKDK